MCISGRSRQRPRHAGLIAAVDRVAPGFAEAERGGLPVDAIVSRQPSLADELRSATPTTYADRP